MNQLNQLSQAATGALLMIGTRKGLWIATADADRSGWQLSGPHFAMSEVYSVAIDPQPDGARLLAGVTSLHWGPTVCHSDDLGQTWADPAAQAIAFPEGLDTSVERVWQLAPAGGGVVFAGTQPSALWRSVDRGETFSLVRGLWDHPHRPKWEAGFGGQAIHTILPHPDSPDVLTVAMSTGGVYRSTDGGDSWSPANNGISAYFLPDPQPEFGQCVHKLAADPARPDQMYAQNHHGVYRSDDAGAHWVSIADGLPSDFGFPIVVHPGDPDTVYVFPLVADSNRIPPDARTRVFRSTDAGRNWQPLTDGLPSGPSYAPVLRDALCTDLVAADGLAGIYFGTRDGCVYASGDGGDHWQQIAAHLPDVCTLRAAVLR